MKIISYFARFSAFYALSGVLALVYGESLPPGFVCTGHVESVFDGDTVLFQCEGDEDTYKVRLAEIDTPESDSSFKSCFKQPSSNSASDVLRSLVDGQDILIDVATTDRYGRVIGHLYTRQLNINLEMVRTGAAHHYEFYSKDERYADAEQSAMKQNAGIWALPESCRMRPWDWRRLDDRERCILQQQYKHQNCTNTKRKLGETPS